MEVELNSVNYSDENFRGMKCLHISVNACEWIKVG